VKILLTVHQFFPDYFSGTEVLTFSVAKELLQRGHSVFVFTGYPAKSYPYLWSRFDSYDLEGIEVHRFHHSFTPTDDQNVVSEIEYDNHLASGFFAHLVDTIQPDVIHFFHFSRLGSSLVDVARQKSIPTYYTPTDFWALCPTCQLLLGNGQVCHGPTRGGGNCIKHVAALTHWRHLDSIFEHVPNWMVDTLAFFARSGIYAPFPFRQEIAALSRRHSFNTARLNALHGIFSPTQLMTDVLTRHGVDSRLIVQSAYGLDISGFDEVQRQFDPARPLTFGYIGTLAPHKGCHVLIEAFLRLNKNSAKLKIYGNLTQFPEYVEKLQTLAADHDDIIFLGTFPNDQIANVFAGIDTLIVPSVWYENTPLVVYSALAAKCPVIASNFPGMSEAIHDGHNGLTFEPGNAEALFDCLQRLTLDSALLEKLSMHCQKPKSIASYVDELLALYVQSDRYPLHAIPDRPVIKSFKPKELHGQIAGWVAVSFGEPLSIRIVSHERELLQTVKMHPRPDVRDGLKKSGHSPQGVNFGFAITLHEPVVPTEVALRIESQQGEQQEIAVGTLALGKSIKIAPNILIAINELTFANNEQKLMPKV
jgi:glycosyltransferase involved in cell wall biosynthesis